MAPSSNTTTERVARFREFFGEQIRYHITDTDIEVVIGAIDMAIDARTRYEDAEKNDPITSIDGCVAREHIMGVYQATRSLAHGLLMSATNAGKPGMRFHEVRAEVLRRSREIDTLKRLTRGDPTAQVEAMYLEKELDDQKNYNLKALSEALALETAE